MTPDWAKEFYEKTGVGVVYIRPLEPWEVPDPARDAAISELVHGDAARKFALDDWLAAVERIKEAGQPG